MRLKRLRSNQLLVKEVKKWINWLSSSVMLFDLAEDHNDCARKVSLLVH